MQFCRILDNNLLLGTIPKQIGKLKSLKVLDLGVNQFMGPIPPEIGGLTSITKMYEGVLFCFCFLLLLSYLLISLCSFVSLRNLRSNGLTGSLPPELGNLVSLVELHLNKNNLNGIIPASNNTKSSSKTIGM